MIQDVFINMELNKQLRIRINEKQFNELVDAIQKEKLTLSSIIRAAITDKLKKVNNEKKPRN